MNLKIMRSICSLFLLLDSTWFDMKSIVDCQGETFPLTNKSNESFEITINGTLG